MECGVTYHFKSSRGDSVGDILVSMAAAGSGIVPLTEAQFMNLANGNTSAAADIFNFLASEMDTTTLNRPQGYLVYLAYDRQLNLVPANSGAKQVENPNEFEQLLTEEILMRNDGFLHIYVSNGSTDKEIIFDNSCGERSRTILITTAKGKVRQINYYGSACAFASAIADGLRISGLNGISEDYTSTPLSASLNMYTSKELRMLEMSRAGTSGDSSSSRHQCGFFSGGTGEFDQDVSSGLEMYDFHARFYDPQLGRWFTPDPAEQFHNPYLVMGNNPVMYVDPDGESVVLVLGIGALVGAYVGGATAAGAGGLVDANWNPFGGEQGSWGFNDPDKDVLGGMVGGAITGMTLASGAAGAGVFGAKAKTAMAVAKTTKGAKIVGTTSRGLFNMMNHHDSQKGFGWHSLGYFAAGAIGAGVGIEGGAAAGIAAGGLLNIGAVAATGDRVTRAQQMNGKSGYTLLQAFVGGAVSSMAGKNIYDSAVKSWGLEKTGSPLLTKNSFGKFINYGSSTVAANYAFDKKGKFQDTHAGVHAMSFFVGGFAGSLNSKLMGDNQFYGESSIGNFAKRIGMSATVLHGEYFLNKQLNSNYISWYDYRRYKRGPLGIKASGYSSFYGF